MKSKDFKDFVDKYASDYASYLKVHWADGPPISSGYHPLIYALATTTTILKTLS